MVVNFRARGISRGARKLTRTPTLNYSKKNKKKKEKRKHRKYHLSQLVNIREEK
jgi:hypothetical protein